MVQYGDHSQKSHGKIQNIMPKKSHRAIANMAVGILRPANWIIPKIPPRDQTMFISKSECRPFFGETDDVST